MATEMERAVIEAARALVSLDRMAGVPPAGTEELRIHETVTVLDAAGAVPRRFLVSYQWVGTRGGFGFGSIYRDQRDGAFPDPAGIAALREQIAEDLGIDRERVVVLAVSEVSAEGQVVT